MTRDEQITTVNEIVNQPEILSLVAPGFDYVDLSAFFDRPGNFMVGNHLGVVLFGDMGEGFYSAHFLLTKNLRGRDAVTALRMAFTSLFTITGAVAITGMIPRENRASRAMARALGCRPLGSTKDALGRACTSYIMERGTWQTLSGLALEP